MKGRIIEDYSALKSLTIIERVTPHGEPYSIDGYTPYYVLEFDEYGFPYAVATHNYETAESLPDDHPMKFYNPLGCLISMSCALSEGISLSDFISGRK